MAQKPESTIDFGPQIDSGPQNLQEAVTQVNQLSDANLTTMLKDYLCEAEKRSVEATNNLSVGADVREPASLQEQAAHIVYNQRGLPSIGCQSR